jgi:hypothetical protein
MEKKTGLELLREPFPENQISQLPKGTKVQNACPANEKVNCKICGGWHHPKVIHLSYVGHAALTDRLLDADPLWTWEPVAYKDGLPAFDSTGGLWIKLTVCGLTRLGYGHAEASNFKEIGSREKEVIGDALRNSAMRFGAALDLWHKGELHVIEEDEKPAEKKKTSGAFVDQKHDDVPLEPSASPPQEVSSQSNIASSTGNPALISEAQGKRLYAISKQSDISVDDIKIFLNHYYKLDSMKTIPKDKYKEISDVIESKEKFDVMMKSIPA